MNILRLNNLVIPRGFPILKSLIRLIKPTYILENSVAALGTTTIVFGVLNPNLRNQLNQKESATTGIITTTISTITTQEPIDMSKFRLPRTVIPNSYDLYLYPHLQSGLFDGKVIITTKIQNSTDRIVLNTNKLNITKVIVNNNIEVQYNIDNNYEQITITRIDGKNFEVGDGILTLEYNGDMTNRIVGFYRSSYNNNKGEQRYIATSKFEPTYARQAYPCFDEPNLKAKYTVHLLKPNDTNYIALSNYPQSSEEPVNDGILVHFNTTVPMSTYLSCFIVSDFVYTQTHFDNEGKMIPFRVYASPGQLDKTTYAGHVGKIVIEYYIKYFKIPYPLPKLDLVAIPDFVSGAMEHWGLVTFRETALLYTNKTHSSNNKQRVATVVAHELAHSWFGNLVTMDWWDNLWLNEGFASYIEYKGVNAAEPDWGMLDQFLIRDLHSILKLDATQGSHPIIQTVTTPDQITEVFDSISYNKGAAILRMLEDVVGEENFRQGVTNYLNAHLYGNAITQDLWDELQNVTNNQLDITDFMNTFTIQMGYPILTIDIIDDKYVVKQKRFLKDPDQAKDNTSPLGYKWTVPVTYITDRNRTRSDIFWFDYKINSLIIEKPTNVKWLKFNPSQIGYYRVNYPEQQWNELIDIIDQLTISDRAHLIEETFSIAESGDLNYHIPLNLTKYLKNEFDYVPWSVASDKLQMILDYLENSQYESEFKKYIATILKPVYDKLTWNTSPDDKHLQKLGRVTVLTLACEINYQDALNRAKEIFNIFINQSVSVDQDLRGIVYKYGMFDADETTWLKLFDLFVNESDANEKLKLMNGLAYVQNPSLLTKLIELAKNDKYVRSQDYFILLQYIASNKIGRPIIWDYVREHWLELVERFTLNDRYLGSLIPAITKRFNTHIKLDEMNGFFKKYPEAGAGAANRKRALENVQNNIKWLAKYRGVVENWINGNKK